MTQQFDPWTNGTPGYRRALVLGMGSTFLGVILLVLAAVVGPDPAAPLQRIGLALVGLGIVSHLFSLVLRRRQAKEILRAADRSDRRTQK